MNSTKSVMIVGVGGQGTLLTSRILGDVLLNQGFDVKLSEVHGMAQRGGSVVTYVRYGETVNSPIVNENEADIVLAFEELEAYRWIPCLKPGGTVIINTQQILPMPVITGKAKYPTEIVEKIKAMNYNLIAIDALKMALECGNAKAVNMVLLAVLAKHLNIDTEIFMESMKNNIKPNLLDLNVKAFNMGYNA